MAASSGSSDPGGAAPHDSVDQAGGPTVSRIVLGTQLRRLREASGITREEAGASIRASHAKISRLELGRVGFKLRDIVDLLTLYGVADERERAGYLGLATQANVRSWWQRNSDLLPGWFEMYLRLEQESSIIRTYQVQFVPGLLQSPQYAREVILAGPRVMTERELDRRVQLRIDRQKILTGPDAPQLWAVLDEAALSRPFGSAEVMREQVRHLLEITALPNLTVQVLPFRLGAQAAAVGPFSILRFAERDLPDVVYLEQLNSAVYVEKRSDVEEYLAVMARMSVQAETPARSRAVLQELLDTM